MYYAIITDGSITTHGTALQLWPGVTFAGQPDPEYLEANNAQVVIMTKPHDPAVEVLDAVEPYLEGGLVYGVEVTARPPNAAPDWAGFGQALISTDEFKNIYAVNNTQEPLPTQALLNAVQFAETGDIARFVSTWENFKANATLTEQELEDFKALAQQYRLPQELIDEL